MATIEEVLILLNTMNNNYNDIRNDIKDLTNKIENRRDEVEKEITEIKNDMESEKHRVDSVMEHSREIADFMYQTKESLNEKIEASKLEILEIVEQKLLDLDQVKVSMNVKSSAQESSSNTPRDGSEDEAQNIEPEIDVWAAVNQSPSKAFKRESRSGKDDTRRETIFQQVLSMDQKLEEKYASDIPRYLMMEPEYSKIKLGSLKLMDIVEFFKGYRKYVKTYKHKFNLIQQVADRVVGAIVTRSKNFGPKLKGLTMDTVYDLSSAELIVWISRVVQPLSRHQFLMYMEQNAIFDTKIAGYKPTAVDYKPMQLALNAYREDFEMLFNLLSEYNKPKNIPAITNKDGGIIKVWLAPLGEYGNKIHIDIPPPDKGKWDTLESYLDKFFDVVAVHQRLAEHTKQLQLALTPKKTNMLTINATKPLANTDFRRKLQRLHHIEEQEWVDEDDDLINENMVLPQMPVYNDEFETDQNDEVDSSEEFNEQLQRLAYLQEKNPAVVPPAQMQYNKLFSRAKDTNIKPYDVSKLHNNTKSTAPCYVHFDTNGNCPKGSECPYRHDLKAMAEIWNIRSKTVSESKFKPVPQKFNNMEQDRES